MTPRLSKAVLTSHITFSVGWLGAVVVFLILAITGLTSQDMQTSRACLIAMELSAWFVIVPFCFYVKELWKEATVTLNRLVLLLYLKNQPPL